MAQSSNPKERRSPPSQSKSPAKAETSANWDGTSAKPATGMRGEVKLALMLVMTLAGAFGYIVYRKFDAIQQVAAAEEVNSLKFQPLKPRSNSVEEVQLSGAPDQADEPPFLESNSSRGADTSDMPWATSTARAASVATPPATSGDHPFLASSAPQAPVQSEPNALGGETFDPGKVDEPGLVGNTEPQPLSLSETRLIAASESMSSRQESSPTSDSFLPAKSSAADDTPSDLFTPATTPPKFPTEASAASKQEEPSTFLPSQEEPAFPTPPRDEPQFRPAVEPSRDEPFAPADTLPQPAAMPRTAERPSVADSENPFAPVTISPATEPVVPQPALPAEPNPFTTTPAVAEPAAMAPVTASPVVTSPPLREADIPFAPATFPTEPAPAAMPLVEASPEPRPLPRSASSSPLTNSIATPAAAFTPSYEPAPALSSPPAFSTEQFYTVRPGDNYWSISRNLYGTSRYFNALSEYNRERIPDPSRMQPGSQVAAPPRELLEQRYPDLCGIATTAAPGAAPAAANERGQFFVGPGGQPQYRVGQGDTLTGIAQKHLGRGSRWTAIFELNRDVLPTADTLKPGTILKLPPDASQVALTPEASVGR